MCKAFAGIAVRSGRVYWRRGLDSHEDLKREFKLRDARAGGAGGLALFGISPKNGDYLKPDEWVFKFDDGCPSWWRQSHERACWNAFREWKKQVYSIMRVKKILALKNSFRDLKPPRRITGEHKALLAEVASVRASMEPSVWASVRDSVWASVGVHFDIASRKWKYTEKIKAKGYPFAAYVRLWNAGLVPSFDGTTWRLRGGKEGKVLYEVAAAELRKGRR